jgi:hypothetical protein
MVAKTRTFVFGLMSVGLSGVVVLSLMVTPYLWDLSPMHPKAWACFGMSICAAFFARKAWRSSK